MHNEKCDSYKHDAFENCMPDSLPHRHTMFLLLDHFDVSKETCHTVVSFIVKGQTNET